VHNAVLYHAYSGRMALGLGPGVKYWCTADPGWVTGTSYGIIAPLVNRVTMLSTRRSSTSTAGTDGAGREGGGLVLRAHRDPHDDARRRDVAKQPYDFSSLASWPAWASR
jgi:acetyl-CoA synthetase